jgi:hypothetical protein
MVPWIVPRPLAGQDGYLKLAILVLQLAAPAFWPASV